MRYEFWMIILCMTFIASGCARKEPPAIRINDIEISKDEFFQAYQTSPFYQKENADPQLFLDQYISRKIILREAERLGLDRDTQFLADVQQYWEQGLLKLILARKNDELSAVSEVRDQEIADYYHQNSETLFAEKSFDESRRPIQEFLGREKQKQALQAWVEELNKKAEISVDNRQLEFKPPQ